MTMIDVFFSRDWTEVAEVLGREHSYTVPNLKEGDEVSFRIRAVNAVGPGEPSRPTDAIKVEDQPGKIVVYLSIRMDIDRSTMRL